MKILVLSGKGGTGKTTVANMLIENLNSKMYADCDVDAPNLHLNHDMNLVETRDFYSFKKYSINQDICIGCGKCYKACNFDAIEPFNNKYKVIALNCEGCSLCQFICPVGAIEDKLDLGGYNYLYEDSGVVFSTALIKTGLGNSGKLVSEVKKILFDNDNNSKYVIIDGSPGIGCPVIASINGMDYIVIVTEASASGLSDLKRLMATCQKMKQSYGVIINKSDLNQDYSKKVIDFLVSEGHEFLGEIPFSKELSKKNNNEPYDKNDDVFKNVDQIINKIREK